MNGSRSPDGGVVLGWSQSGTPNSRNAADAIAVNCGLDAPPAYHCNGTTDCVQPAVPPRVSATDGCSALIINAVFENNRSRFAASHSRPYPLGLLAWWPSVPMKTIVRRLWFLGTLA